MELTVAGLNDGVSQTGQEAAPAEVNGPRRVSLPRVNFTKLAALTLASLPLAAATHGCADEAGRYRAFVGYDPEGYYMEFDLFRAHPSNASLIPYLGTPATK